MTQATVLTTVEMRFRGKTKIDPATNKPAVDEKGEKIVVKDRENFSLQLPLLTLAGVGEIISNGSDKAKDAILNAVNLVIQAQAKKQVDEGVSDQASLDMSVLDWEKISELSASEMSESAAPTKEVLDALATDYVAIMPTAIGVSTEQAKAAAKEFAAKFRNVKLRPDMVEKLLGRLATWFEATSKQEQFAEAYDWLATRATSYIEEAKKKSESEMF